MAKKLEKLDLSTFPALERRVTRLREGAGELLQRELQECFVQELAARQVVRGFPPMELVRFPSK